MTSKKKLIAVTGLVLLVFLASVWFFIDYVWQYKVAEYYNHQKEAHRNALIQKETLKKEYAKAMATYNRRLYSAIANSGMNEFKVGDIVSAGNPGAKPSRHQIDALHLDIKGYQQEIEKIEKIYLIQDKNTNERHPISFGSVLLLFLRGKLNH